MYDDDYNWDYGVVIEKLRKLIKEMDGRFEWYGWELGGWDCYLIVMCFVLMLWGKYIIVEKFRVKKFRVVGKVKVERWGLFLILVKR